MEIHICSITEYDTETRMPTIVNPDSSTFYLVPTEDGTSPDLFTEWVYVNNAWEMFGSMKIDLSGYLTDVTVNGTSIVSDGVAEIPLADSNKFGVVKLNGNYGIQKNTSNLAVINKGNDSEIKIGTNSYKPIVPYSQHMSTFYGLAKAASDTTQSASSNAVGTYTEDAKSKIQNMLGITDKYSPKEWVAESETELVTNAHSVGDLFYIGETLYKVIADLNAGDAINVGVNVEEVNVDDILDDYATKEDVQDNVSIVEKSASGAIASFPDGADGIPLKSLVVNIDLVQDLHGYDSPWVGGGGKNLCNAVQENVLTYSSTYSDFTVENGTVNANGNVLMGFLVPVKPSTNYTYSFKKMTTNSCMVRVRLYSDKPTTFTEYFIEQPTNQYIADTATSMSVTVATTADTKYIFAGLYITGNPLTISDFQVEEGSIATDWTPYENICPISGWTGCEVNASGKNLVDISRFATEYPNYCSFSNGVLTVTSNSALYSRGINVDIPQGSVLNWTITNGTSVNARLRIVYEDGTVRSHSSPIPLTVSKRITALRFDWGTGGTFTVSNFQAELNATATPYEPYNGQSITIDLGQTVYGGHLDVLSGELTIDRAMYTFDGSEAWAASATPHRFSTNTWVYLPYRIATQPMTQGAKQNVLTSVFGECVYTNADGVGYIVHQSRGALFVVNESAATTVNDIKAMVTGMQFCYELATPIEIQLDVHTINSLYGTNNIFADTGNTFVEYFSQVDKDLIDYIETSLKPYAKEEKLNDYVDDVQINGQSIVSDGVANVPVAGANQLGVVGKPSNSFGILINASGQIYTYGATDSDIKNGTSPYRPLNATTQHKSVFYGLAKASGDTTQSTSSNVVGNYTDNAKDKIQTMLGVSPLIAPHESDPFESAHVVGELFIINGKLYRAKTALTAGEYINEGTNIEVVDVAEVLDGKVEDVQVNGTSIVSDEVANIPFIGNNRYGIAKLGANVGTCGLSTDSTGVIYVDRATSALVKDGTNRFRPIAPDTQHESTFYGLAKASGDTTQSQSNNAVGTYTDEAKASIQTMLGVPSEDNVVNDVQIDGTSIVSDGVVNVPIADNNSTYGLVKVRNGIDGVAIASNGALSVAISSETYIKAGTESRKVLTPAYQHASTFYGLAKAAGDTTQSQSSNAVGSYTNEAKIAIKQMLGIHDTIDSFVEEVTGTDVTITGQPSYRYNCGEVLSLTVTPPSSGTIDIRFTSGSTPTVLTLPQTVKMPEWWVEVEANTIYEMCITDGIYCGVMTWAM